MATKAPRRPTRRAHEIHKPNGSVHPRVQKVGPQHFGIVAVDCAKARSKWMLADFYGNVLVPPTEVEHDKPSLKVAIDRIRQTSDANQILDLIVVVERTGRYHQVVREAFRTPASTPGSSIPSPPSSSDSPPIPATKPTTPTSPPSTEPPSTASDSPSRPPTPSPPESNSWPDTVATSFERLPSFDVKSVNISTSSCQASMPASPIPSTVTSR